MEGRGMGRGRGWKNLKQKIRFKAMGCCGSSWGFQDSTQMPEIEEDHHRTQEEEEEEEEDRVEVQETMAAENLTATRNPCVGGGNQMPATAGMMNLATALAAERQFRATEKQSLMKLLEEGEEEEEEEEMRLRRSESSGGSWCCVCMERRKGAAFIPCGHTFCRVCSREVWLNRGCCPLCNRPILDVLDIF